VGASAIENASCFVLNAGCFACSLEDVGSTRRRGLAGPANGRGRHGDVHAPAHLADEGWVRSSNSSILWRGRVNQPSNRRQPPVHFFPRLLRAVGILANDRAWLSANGTSL